MDAKAIHRFARISPQKAREVTREIQGMDVNSALAVLNYTPKKAALLIGKTLQSAIANANHNYEMDEETLYVKSATATTGPSLKRIMPRARGSAAPIKKRMSHITVIVSQRTKSGDDGAKVNVGASKGKAKSK
ncbi:MAG: 50S ribosomal protein L22 [Verrucomicrobiaceae bacterium]|nr:50S ribosomal protein L22 [Verrucomicrobiaceae bacterium]